MLRLVMDWSSLADLSTLIDLGGTLAFAVWVGLEVRTMRQALTSLVERLATLEERLRPQIEMSHD